MVIATDKAGGELSFRVAASLEAMRINSAGNVGVGVVPKAWQSIYDGLQVGNSGSISGYSGASIDRMWVTANGYVHATSGTWKRIVEDTASQYEQRDGVHNFFSSGLGSADTDITWTKSMVLDINSRISLSNNDENTSNTVFGYHALTNAGTVLENVGADYTWLWELALQPMLLIM